MIKQAAKKIIHSLGWDLRRYNVFNDACTQLFTALQVAQIDLVFDIGANIGQFAKELRSAGYAGRIVSFEPLSIAHRRLCENAGSDRNWLIHPRTAVGDQDGEIEINISHNSVSSSVLPMLPAHSSAAPNSAYVSSECTSLIRLDSIASNYLTSSSGLFIKIDTQGYEWQVLDGATETLKLAKVVLLELSLTPLYKGQKLWRDTIDRVQAEGFTLWAIKDGFSDPTTGRTLQLDAVFLRSELVVTAQ